MVDNTYRNCAVKILVPHANSARQHSKEQLHQVAESIRTFGFINPIVIDGNNRIIAGHARVEAAKLLKKKDVPTIQITQLNDDQLRAYILADNKLAENASWDEQALKVELEYLTSIDLEFDEEITGFSTTEIDLIIDCGDEPNDEPIEDIPAVPSTPVVKRGDIFELGPHRIMCGDCRDASDMTLLMDGRVADAVCTDPPFNVSIKGHVLSSGTVHSEFAVASGELSPSEFTDFLKQSMKELCNHSRDGSVHFLFMDWRHIQEIIAAGLSVYDTFLNMCVWVKTNGGMGSFYRSQHELVFVFRNGSVSHTNNIQLGKYGRNRSNVWTYAGMNSFGEERDEALASHPTVKPIAMIADAIKDVSKRGDLILDSFLGSGTTLIAAEQSGRRCYGVEIDPGYIEVIIKRFQKISDLPVIHQQTGLSFAELKKQRSTQTEEHNTNV